MAPVAGFTRSDWNEASTAVFASLLVGANGVCVDLRLRSPSSLQDHIRFTRGRAADIAKPRLAEHFGEPPLSRLSAETQSNLLRAGYGQAYGGRKAVDER